ncbi:MAG: hypothetical protein IPG68_09720 [Micrococcales bacterium]|nr:hypothetical protein [Micrococcales bacterium]
MSTVLALVSGLAWSSVDFLGGQVSKRYPAFFVVGVSQAVGLPGSGVHVGDRCAVRQREPVLRMATTGSLSLVSVLASLYPGVTVPLAWRFLSERLKPIQYVGVALALGGVAQIVA